MLRQQSGLTLQQLGDAIGMSVPAVSMLEKGLRSPSFEILCEIANFFGVSFDFLLGKEDTSASNSGLNNNERKINDSTDKALKPGVFGGSWFAGFRELIAKNFPKLQPHEELTFEELLEYGMLKEVCAKRLSELLQQKEISLHQLGNQTGVSYEWLRSLVEGKSSPNFGLICVLADFFDVSFSYLIGDTDDPKDGAGEMPDVSSYLNKKISCDIPCTPVGFLMSFLDKKAMQTKNSQEKENLEICLEAASLLARERINRRGQAQVD